MRHDTDKQLQTEDLLGDRREPTAADERADTGYRDVEPKADETDLDAGRHGGLADPKATDPRAADPRLGEHRTGQDRVGSVGPVDQDHRVDGSTTRVDDSSGDWDGAPTYDPGPAVDQDTTHGYAEAAPEQQEHHQPGAPTATDGEEPGAELFSDEEVERFRGQWQAIQGTFVDDPRDAVQGADHLVAEVMQALAATFTEHKRGLEDQWQNGSDAQTEDLRQALRRYRSFFNQLLHT